MSRIPFRATACVLFACLGLFSASQALAQGDNPKVDPAVKVDPAATRDYAVAADLHSRKLYLQAVARWQKFVQTYPEDPRVPNAYHQLGVGLLEEKKFAESAAAFAAILEKFPKFEAVDGSQFNRGMALYNLGLESRKAQDFRTAAREFAEVPTKFPKSKYAPPALYYQGEAHYQAGDRDGAIQSYQKSIADYPDSDVLPSLYYALGTAQQELGKHKDAAEAFQTFLKKFPRDDMVGECTLRLGQSLFKEKAYAEASRYFAAAAKIKDFPHADYAQLQQAQCDYEQNLLTDAARSFEQLPKSFPKSRYAGPASVAAGKCWFQAGRYNDAQTILSTVTDAKNEEAPEALYWLGQTLIKLDKAADALSLMDGGIALNPKGRFVPHLTFVRINALMHLPDRSKESSALFADFVKKNATNDLAPRAAYLAALACLRNEDFATGQKYAEQFLLNKSYATNDLAGDLLFVGGECYLRAARPDYAHAEELYRRLLTEFPKNPSAPQATLRVGLCLHLAKKYDESIKFLQTATESWKDPALLAEAHLLIGRDHQESGRLDAAVAALQSSVRAKADWDRGDEVLLTMAACHRADKKSAEAYTALQKLTTAFPKSPLVPQALYDMGGLAYDQQKYTDSQTNYEKLVDRFPDNKLVPRAIHGIGLTEFARKNYSQAVDVFTRQLAVHANSDISPRSKYLRGLAHQQLKQHEAAAKDLTDFLASKPAEADAVEARFTLGLAQVGLKQFDAAAATLKSLLKDFPNYVRGDQACYEMAFALQETKNDKDAATAFRELAVKWPASPFTAESWFRVGSHHEGKSELADAATAFEAGIDKAKDPALKEKLQYKHGWVQYQRKQYGAAATALKAQVKEFPRGALAADATYLAGECHFKQGDFPEALPFFESLAKVKDEKYQARALYRAGACQGSLKDWKASQAHYEMLLKIYPNFEQVNEARYGLGWALQNQDRLMLAKQTYEKVTQASDGESAAKSRFMIGELAFKDGKYKDAIVHFLEASKYPYEEWQVLSHFEAGRCFMEMKDLKNARDSFELIVRNWPSHVRARDASKYLSDLPK